MLVPLAGIEPALLAESDFECRALGVSELILKRLFDICVVFLCSLCCVHSSVLFILKMQNLS